MTIRVCVAGATGWTGGAVARQIISSEGFQLTGAVARRLAGSDVGTALGLSPAGVQIAPDLASALTEPTDVLIDYTSPEAVKRHTILALERGVRVVIGSSGLTAQDYEEIAALATAKGLGVIAAGNFSITAALAKHFALETAKYIPSWEIIDYASAGKMDAPSGTVQELAEELGQVARPRQEVAPSALHGRPDTRGAEIEGTQVHSLRLPSYVIAFETIFGLPNERLTIRHDAGSGADPYVAGTLLATREVLRVQGLVRGLDRLLFA
jgi:4-hydroxy-tetrahydrodipicolinate reductase